MNIVAYILSLEVTQDCNLVCSHCLNGERRKVTMSDEVIRSVFAKVCIVDNLILTGGEVFLAYDVIKRVLEIAREMNVEILNCSMVINGCIYDKRIYNLLDEYFKDNYHIYISYDVYHDNSIERIYQGKENSSNPEINPQSIEDIYNNMHKHMDNRHFRGFKNLGNKLINKGRAKNLPGEKHSFEVMGYYYDFCRDNMLMVGPAIFVSADGFITDGNDEIAHYKEGSLGSVLDCDWDKAIINGGIHVPCKNTDEFVTFLKRREDEYQKIIGEHYIIENGQMKVTEIRKSNLAEKELAKFINYFIEASKEGLSIDKILSYDFSSYPSDLSLMEHME